MAVQCAVVRAARVWPVQRSVPQRELIPGQDRVQVLRLLLAVHRGRHWLLPAVQASGVAQVPWLRRGAV